MLNLRAVAIKRALGTLISLTASLACSTAGAEIGSANNGWVDLIIKNGHLFIPSEVAGHKGYALIDTGGELNAVNETFIADAKINLPHGRRINIFGVHGRDLKPVIKSLPVSLLGNDQTLTDVVRTYLGSSEVQLLLGGRFLSASIFQFDYPNKRMRVLPREENDLRETKNVKSKKDRVGGSPIVQVSLNEEKKVWLTMDTGTSSGILLRRSIATSRGWLGRYATKRHVSAGINKSEELVQFTLPSLSIGDFETLNPTVYVARKFTEVEFLKRRVTTGSHIKKSETLADGVLGHDVLKNFVVTVDYREGHVHLDRPEVLTD